jgi:hypothetical protein
VQRLRGVKLSKVRSIVNDKDEIVLASVAQDIPVLPACLADVCHVVRFAACLGRDSHELNAETLVDQESHEC